MNKLFIYGCSFSHGDGAQPHEKYALEYKKSKDDLIWPEIVANKLDLKLCNYSMGGISNDMIFDKIIESFDEISKNDVVIIQKTFTHRFDIECNRKKYESYNKNGFTVTPHNDDLLKKQGFDDREIESILYTCWLMDNAFNDRRIDNRFNFLKKLFLKKSVSKCIIWDLIKYQNRNIYETIQDASNGEIKDLHWSFNGHRTFSETILNKIKEEAIDMVFDTTKKII